MHSKTSLLAVVCSLTFLITSRTAAAQETCSGLFVFLSPYNGTEEIAPGRYDVDFEQKQESCFDESSNSYEDVPYKACAYYRLADCVGRPEADGRTLLGGYGTQGSCEPFGGCANGFQVLGGACGTDSDLGKLPKPKKCPTPDDPDDDDKSKCSMPGDLCPCGAKGGGGPVMTASGAMFLNPIVDFSVEHPASGFSWKRYYSTTNVWKKVDSDLGPGWSHTLADRLDVNSQSQAATWTREDGHEIRFECADPLCAQFRSAFSREARLARVGTEYEIVTRRPAQKLVFRNDGKLLRVLHPGVGQTWVPRVELDYFEAGAANLQCQVPPGALGEGQLCQVSLPSSIGGIAYEAFHLTYVHSVPPGCQSPRDLLSSVTIVSSGRELVRYDFGLSCDGGGACDPDCAAPVLLAAAVNPAEPALAVPRWTYSYDYVDLGQPLLTGVESGDAPGVLPYFAERHEYSPPEFCTQNGQCASGFCSAQRCTCPNGFADCTGTGECIQGRCQGHRRTIRSSTNCESFGGGAYGNCEESLDFIYARPAVGAPIQTRVVNAATGRDWTASFDWSHRLLGVTAEGCGSERSYTWESIPSNGPLLDALHITAEQDPLPLSSGVLRFTTYAFEDANAAMQPTITIHGDDDQDPINGGPSDALIETRTYTTNGDLASIARPTVVENQGASLYYDIFDYGDAGPVLPSPLDTPEQYNQGNISRLLRRRVQIGFTWTGGAWERAALISDYAWDPQGRLTESAQSTSPPTQLVKTGYDYYAENDPQPQRRGRLRKILTNWDPGAGAYRTEYRIDAYSELGRPTQLGGPFDRLEAVGLPWTTLSYLPASEAPRGVARPDRPNGWESHSWSYNPDGSIAAYTDDAHSSLAMTYVAGRPVAQELFAGAVGASASLGETTFDWTPTAETVRWQTNSTFGGVVKRASQVTYDPLGNRQAAVRYGASESSADGVEVEHRDHLGRVLWSANEEYATGYSSECVLDSQLACILPDGGACPQSDDCWNATTKYRYDARGRVSEVWQRVAPGVGTALHLVKSLGYDVLGHLTSVEDEVGRVTLYSYDDFGALVSVEDPDLGYSAYEYDAAGRLLSADTESRNSATVYSYDQSGRLSEVAFGEAPGTWTLTYGDDPGFAAPVECLTGVAGIMVGSWGRLSEITETDQPGDAVSTFLDYSVAGSLAGYSTVYPGEACSYTALHFSEVVNGSLVEKVSYPFSGRVVSMTYDGAYPASVDSTLDNVLAPVLKSLTFEGLGDLAGFDSETAALAARFSSERHFFLDGTPSVVTASYNSPMQSGGLSLRTAVTARDPRGFPASIVQANRTLANGDALTNDDAGRLTYAVNGDPQSGAAFDESQYSYWNVWPVPEAGLWNVLDLDDDAVSYIPGTNRIHMVGSKLEYCYGTWDPVGEACLPGAFGAGLEGAVRSIFDHDTGELLELDYDAALRLRTATSDSSQASYRYDALGRRIQKVVDHVGGATTETRFAYDDADRLVSEMTASGAAEWSVRDYVWVGSELVAALDSALDTSTSPWTVTEGQKYYVVSDLRSAPIALIDASGLAVWRASYDPLGAATVYSSTNLEAIGLPAGDALPGGGGADDVARPETDHPYPNSQTRAWMVRRPFGASQYYIDFEQFETEVGADLVTVESAFSLQVVAGPFSGGLGAFSAGPFDEDVLIVLTSDSHSSGFPGPFGFVVPRVRAEYGDVEMNLRLSGQYFDVETGLHYNLHRTYDPKTGRYLQPEPLLQQPEYVFGMAKSGMRVPAYSYAFNNPLHFTDPTGLYGTEKCDYYADQCAKYGGKYYCEQAPYWCNKFPKPSDPDPSRDDDYEGWPRCVRQCLQDCDELEHREDDQCPAKPDDRKGPWDPRSTSFDCHAGCYSWCAIPSTPYEPNLPLRKNPFK